ncbi:MAG: hypothetical protein M3Q79_00615 [bacterium]|nr:hypothetical protein [bacterium]
MAEDFPKPGDEKFVSSDESLDDDDDEEEEPKEKSEKKSSRGIFEAWLKREKTDESESDSNSEESDSEKPQNALQKLGSIFFDSEGREVVASEEDGTTETVEAEQYEELSAENYEASNELAESENIIEGAPEIPETSVPEVEPVNDDSEPKPTVVFERSQSGVLSTPRTESEPAAEASDEALTYEATEEEPAPIVYEDLAAEPPNRGEEPEVTEPTDTYPSAGYAASGTQKSTSSERPAEIHEHHEHIEKRGGGISLADVLIYRNASNKIRAQGKKIEQLRNQGESNKKGVEALQHKPDRASTSPELTVIEQNPKQIEKIIESVKFNAESKTSVEKLIENASKANKPNKQPLAAEKLNRKEVPEELESEIIKNTSEIDLLKETEEERLRRIRRIEAIEKEAEAKEDAHELVYETSHESKQFTATALADAIDTSEIKKKIEIAAQGMSIAGASNAAVQNNPANIPSPPSKSQQTYKQAIIAGTTAAILLMAIIFIMYALT